MDEERERGQGQTLPPHTALQLVLSYCVHHCYAGTVRVRSPIPRPPSELSHRHTLIRLAPPVHASVPCRVLLARPLLTWHALPTLTQAIESSCQPPQRHGNNGEDGEGGDGGDDDTVGTGKRLRGLATQWHPHDEQQRAPIVNHVLEGNVPQARVTSPDVPSLPISHPSVSTLENPNTRETLLWRAAGDGVVGAVRAGAAGETSGGAETAPHTHHTHTEGHCERKPTPATA